MKIRNGFVSNSSSSSFVIVGYKMKDLNLSDENKKNMMDKLDYQGKSSYFADNWYDFLYSDSLEKIGKNIGYLGGDGSGYIGLIIVDIPSDSYDRESSSIELSEVNDKIKKLKEFLNVEVDPKIYSDTRSC